MKEVEDEPLDTLYTTKRYTKVSREHYQTVVEGMRSAVLGGTCRNANIPELKCVARQVRRKTVERTILLLWGLHQ